MPDEAGGQARIEELEQRLADALKRIDALEAAQNLAPIRPANPLPRSPHINHRPPPVIKNWAQPLYMERPRAAPPEARPRAEEKPAKPPKPAKERKPIDFEYLLGAKGLTYLGTVFSILALGFLISAAIQRGFITPWMQFGLAAAVSLSFIGFGLHKRGMREDFGAILMAIGSCGMFLAIAGGQVYHHLYSKEILVGAFFTWAMANLGYSGLVRAKPFLVIGFLGGLGAALMPMAERNVAVNVALHFAVVIPSLLIAVRQRWLALTALSWLVSSACLAPAIFSRENWLIALMAFACNAIFAAAAYMHVYRENKVDQSGWYPAVMVAVTGLLSLVVRDDLQGGISILIVGALFGVLAYLRRDTKPAASLGVGAAATVALLSPLGLRGYGPALAFAVYAGLCSLVSLRWAPRPAIVLAASASVAALVMYVVGGVVASPLLPFQELGSLLLVSCAVALTARCGHRFYPSRQAWSSAAAMAGIPLFARLMWVLGDTGMGALISSEALLVLGGLLSSAVLALTSRKWAPFVAGAWCLLLADAALYAAFGHTLPLPVDMLLLTGAAGTILLVSRATKPLCDEKSASVALPASTAALVLLVLTRMSWVAAQPLTGLNGLDVVAGVWFIYAIVLAGLSHRDRRLDGVGLLAAIGGACIHGASIADGLAYAPHSAMLAFQMFSLTVVGRKIVVLSPEKEQINRAFIGALLGGTGLQFAISTVTLVLGQPLLGAAVIGMVAVSFASSVYLALRRNLAGAFLAGGWALAAFIAYVSPVLYESEVVGVSLSSRIAGPMGAFALPMAIGIMTALAVWAGLCWRLSKIRPWAVAIAMVACWPMFTQTGLLTIAGSYDRAHWNWVITALWGLYGAVLMTIGFWQKERILRFGAIGLFGAAVTKIFVWDLGQAIDPLLRIVILFALGIAMLAGGYAYIRTRMGRDEAIEPAS